MPDWSRLQDACACRNLICPISLLVLGIVLGITGGVVAAVGFGTMPKDMFDYSNQAKRLAGLIMVGIAILPIAVSVICWLFYCTERKANKKLSQTSRTTGAPKGRVNEMTFDAARSPTTSDSHEELIIYQHTARDSGQHSSATGSTYSQQYAPQMRSDGSTKSGSHSDDDDSSSSSSANDVKSSKKPLTAVDESADEFE